MNRVFFFASAILLSVLTHGQNYEDVLERDRNGKGFRVVSYNVENLFDTINDALKRDEEYLPNSEKEYNTAKYRNKLGNIAKTIRAIGGWQSPELVGLIEVENRSVLLDLAEHPALEKANFRVLHFDSPDPRGIDVALLYDSTLFHVLHAEPILINESQLRTRDILYAKFLVDQTDTLHVFVNHWSSRRGGKEKSSYKREIAARQLKQITDSILLADRNASILAMGDFNDEPGDQSLNIVTNATNHSLMNLSSNPEPNTGTYKYRGVWNVIDQMLVSPALHEPGRLQIPDGQAYIFRADFLLRDDDKYGDYYPKRSWRGNFYSYGFSDHLPIFLDILFSN